MDATIAQAKKWCLGEEDFSFSSGDKSQKSVLIGMSQDTYFFTITMHKKMFKTTFVCTSTEDDLDDWVVEIGKSKFSSVVDCLKECKKQFDAMAEEEEDGDEDGEETPQTPDTEYDSEEEIVISDPTLVAQLKHDENERDRIKKELENKRKKQEYDPEFEKYAKTFSNSSANKGAMDRLMKDLKNMYKINKKGDLGISAEPSQGDLFKWQVKFFGFDKDDGELLKDMKKYKKMFNQNFVELEMTFPPEYPFKPPFIRVIKPRFTFHTGHVTIGGSICMELITTSGWRPINDIESILIQIRAEIIAGGGRFDFGNTSAYTKHEAESAFFRVARQHGWEK